MAEYKCGVCVCMFMAKAERVLFGKSLSLSLIHLKNDRNHCKLIFKSMAVTDLGVLTFKRSL